MFAAYVYISGIELHKIGSFDYENEAVDALLEYVDGTTDDEEAREYTLANSRIVEE